MAARNTRFRSLTDEFRDHLERRAAFPKYTEVIKKLKNRGGGRRPDVAQMRAGGTVPEKYIDALIELSSEKSAFKDFLIGKQARESSEAVIDLIAGPVMNRAASAASADDWYMMGLEGLVGLFTKFFLGKQLGEDTSCQTEDDVAKAVGMILTTTGRFLAGGKTVTDAEAIGLVEAATKISNHDYSENVIACWKIAPWSVAFAVVDRQRVACSRVVPLTESAYMEIRAGRLSIDACTASDIEIPSQMIFIDASGEMPESDFPFTKKRTAQQIRTTFLQVAHLSYASEFKNTLQILTATCSPTAKKRARKYGFRSTGTRMHEIDIDLMEMDYREAIFVPMVVEQIQRRLFQGGSKS